VRPCLDNSDCFTSYEFCDGPGCTDMGGCALLDSVKCDPSIRDLVCTCDGFTTVNEDCARSVGERIASHGVCDLPDAGLN
jgi:hypothetical protein